jgi:head-tail adaptor
MTFATDIAGDFEAIADGLESITLRGPSGSSIATTEIERALRRSMKTIEAADSDGRYLSTDTVWHFDKRRGTPEIGGTIKDADGTTWRIIDRDGQTLRNRWRCVCREFKIDGGLDTYVTIQRRTYTKATDGSSLWNWTDYRLNVRAKIQDSGAARTIANGQRSNKISASIYFDQEFDLGQQFRVISSDGLIYYFVADNQRDAITGLYYVNAERYE